MPDDSYLRGYWGFMPSWFYRLGSWAWLGALQRESDADAQRAQSANKNSSAIFWGVAIEAGIITYLIARMFRFGIGDFTIGLITYVIVVIGYGVLQFVPPIKWIFLTLWSALVFNDIFWDYPDIGGWFLGLCCIAVMVAERFVLYGRASRVYRFLAISGACVCAGAAVGTTKWMNIETLTIGTSPYGCTALDKHYLVVGFKRGVQSISRNQGLDIVKNAGYKVMGNCGRYVMLENGGITEKDNLAWVDNDHPDIGLHSETEVSQQKVTSALCPQIPPSTSRPSCNSPYVRSQICLRVASDYKTVPFVRNIRMLNYRNRLDQMECTADITIDTMPSIGEVHFSVGSFNGRQYVFAGFR